MIRIKRPVAAVGSAVLLALSLSACGGAPTDASTDDFCEAINDDPTADVADDDAEAQAEAINDYGDNLEEVGTPEDIDDEAREGFEVLVEVAGDVSADDLEDDDAAAALEEQYKDDEDAVTALFEYVGETCEAAVEVPEGESSE